LFLINNQLPQPLLMQCFLFDQGLVDVLMREYIVIDKNLTDQLGVLNITDAMIVEEIMIKERFFVFFKGKKTMLMWFFRNDACEKLFTINRVNDLFFQISHLWQVNVIVFLPIKANIADPRSIEIDDAFWFTFECQPL